MKWNNITATVSLLSALWELLSWCFDVMQRKWWWKIDIINTNYYKYMIYFQKVTSIYKKLHDNSAISSVIILIVYCLVLMLNIWFLRLQSKFKPICKWTNNLWMNFSLLRKDWDYTFNILKEKETKNVFTINQCIIIYTIVNRIYFQ